MKLTIRGQIPINRIVLMNHLGYHQAIDRQHGQESYIRRLGGYHYPRFHIYISESAAGVTLSIHYDEKQPSYSVGHRHSGQYEGQLVSHEVLRIKQALENL